MRTTFPLRSLTSVLAACCLSGCLPAELGAPSHGTVDADDSTPAANQAPLVSAGADQSAESGARVVLDGAATRDPDGDRMTFAWTQVSGMPAVLLEDGFSLAPQFIAPDVEASTVLIFELLANDGRFSVTDRVAVTIMP